MECTSIARKADSVRDASIRILHLVSTFEEKTDTKWLLELCSRMDRKRFRVGIASFYGGQAMRPRFEELGIATDFLNVPGQQDPRALFRAIRLIRRERPDVVHTHLLRADLIGGLAARMMRVPVVLTTAYALGEYRRMWKRRLDPVIDRVGRRLPHHVLAVCQAVKDDCTGRLGWAPEDVTVIHTGIDVRSPDAQERQCLRDRIRDEFGIGRDTELVVTIARLSYEKGLPWLIEAANLLRTRRGSVRFLLVGDGPDRSELQRRIDDLALGANVQLAGFRSDIPAILCAADLAVIPSLMEGMPNTLLEAWSAGLPVVASRVGGLAEVIESERTGLLVPARDPAALAGAVERLLADPSFARQLAEAGRTDVETRFSSSAVARRYEALYMGLLA